MKRFWVFCIASTAIGLPVAAAPATAADLPAPPPVYSAPPATGPIFSWTGFYLGAGIADGLSNTDTSVHAANGAFVAGTNTQGGRGWLGSAVTGFDYQFGDRIVAGLLADFNYGRLSGSFSDPNALGGPSGTMKETAAWAGGGRIGWLVTPEFLTYASGGFTQAHFAGVSLVTTGNAAAGTLPSHTYSGWFVGGGLETTFPFLGNGWFMRSDYRFAQYGSAALTEVGAGGAIVDIQTIRPIVQTATVDLIYKFNWVPTTSAPGPSLRSLIADFFTAPKGPSPWSGLYVAGGGGYGTWNADTWSLNAAGVPLTAIGTQGGRGWFGTVNTGFDYQLTSRIVVGVLGDFDFADITGTFQDQSPTATGTIAGTMTEHWAWAGGVRGGWLATPQMLSYYDVGFTQAAFSSVALSGNAAGNLGVPIANLPSHTYNGWFLGSGLETALPFIGRGWFARIEYRYSAYRSANVAETLAGGGLRDLVSFHPDVQTVRTELVYRFNWAEPVVAWH